VNVITSLEQATPFSHTIATLPFLEGSGGICTCYDKGESGSSDIAFFGNI
jgi:hypothetical protein